MRLDSMNTVMSLENDSSDEWIQSKLKLWRRSGYSVELIEDELLKNSKDSHEIVTKYEGLFIRGEDVRKRMRDLPRNLEFKRHSLIEKMRNLDDVPAIEKVVIGLIKEYRPWALIVEKNISSWKMHGELEKLNELVSRLNNLDPSMIVDAKSIAQYFVDPRMKDRIEKEILELEIRQNKRAMVLNEMEELLSKEGFEINELGDLNLDKRFDEITRVQNDQKKHLKLKHKINQGVGVFDLELAKNFEQRRLQILNSDSSESFIELSNEIENSSNIFSNRLDIINKKIRHWREIGIEFENMGSISADSLYEWENMMPEKQESIDLLLNLRKRLIRQNEIWADEIDNALLGIRRIDLIDKLEDAVESLENKTNLMNIEFDGFVDEWKKRGYNMQKWIGRYNLKPRETIAELKAFAPVLEEGEILRSRIKELDKAMLNENKKYELYEILEDSDIELDTLVGIENEIRLLENREENYRNKLTIEWEKMVKVNHELRKIDISLWDIIEFESQISKIIVNDTGGVSKDQVIASVQKSIQKEFLILEKQGWNMNELYSQLESSPAKLSESLPSIRKQMSQYDRLVSRLMVLPWERCPDKAKLILSQLEMPEKLPLIWEMIPGLIRELSALETVDKDFEFLPWSPIRVEKYQTEIIEEFDDVIINNIEDISVDVESKDEFEKPEQVVVESEVLEIKDTKKIDLTFWEKYSFELEKFANTIGIRLEIWPISSNDEIILWRRSLAENVGVIPRDTRVDRILRLALRCIPSSSDQINLNEYLNLIQCLTKSAKRIHKWTKVRLEYRNTVGSNSLLDDSVKLGNILDRIPGPGINLLLDKDVYELPQSNHILELKSECESLLKISLAM